MVVRVWGIDDGFGDLKGYNGKDSFILPSFVTDFVEKPQDDFSKVEYSHPESHISIEYSNGIKKLVGKGAQILDEKGVWDGQTNKHKSKKFPHMFKTMLALLAKDEMEEEIHVTLVMGLPVDAETEARKQDLVKLVKGKHEFKVTLADDTEIEKIVYVDAVVIQAQPFGTYANKILDKEGNIIDELLKQQMTVVFDLGARTLNVLTQRGFARVPNLSYTRQYGMFDAWTTLRKKILNVHKTPIPVARIPIYAQKGYISGGTNIEGLVEECYSEHADMLLTDFETTFIEVLGEIDTIILTGGGSEVLQHWLKRGLIDRIKDMELKAKVVTGDRLSTVKGYYNFGKRVTRVNTEVAASKEQE